MLAIVAFLPELREWDIYNKQIISRCDGIGGEARTFKLPSLAEYFWTPDGGLSGEKGKT